MSTVKVAINGFGRIGRLVYRQIYNMEGIEVVAINDLTSPKVLAHLLKYDTAQGRFGQDVKATENSIVVNGEEIKIYALKNPSENSLEITRRRRCTGMHWLLCRQDKAAAHLAAGARKVVISAPATGDLKTIVFNVNHSILDGSRNHYQLRILHHQLPCAMAQVLDEKFGIVAGQMTTVHAYTK
jgi:glyceraldehyde 3-phosphate dehydrogenase